MRNCDKKFPKYKLLYCIYGKITKFYYCWLYIAYIARRLKDNNNSRDVIKTSLVLEPCLISIFVSQIGRILIVCIM